MARVLAVLLGLFLALPAMADEQVNEVAAKGTFADVKDDLVAAIEQRGLVINSTSHVGDMLERTGRDLGKTKRVYGQAEVLEFCSATVSRAMMEADPRNLVYCPYTIAIYTLPDQPDRVYMAYRRYPPTASLKPVAELLQGIVAAASK